MRCVCGPVEGVSGSDIKSDGEGECLTLCALVSPLHVCVCLDDDRAACCGRGGGHIQHPGFILEC